MAHRLLRNALRGTSTLWSSPVSVPCTTLAQHHFRGLTTAVVNTHKNHVAFSASHDWCLQPRRLNWNAASQDRNYSSISSTGSSNASSIDGSSSSTSSIRSSSSTGLSDELPPVIISPVPCRVVVIGWMGSKKRYLQKYANLWERSGEHEVLMLRPSIPMTLMRWRGVVVAGQDIDKVARVHIENPSMPTVYHIFSTGGFIHAGTMWRWMDEVEDVMLRRDLLEDVKGIIIDSGPAHIHPDMAARAMVSASLGIPAEEVESRQGALVGLTKGALEWYLQRPSVKQREKEVYESWYEAAPTCPQLYLYSDSDPLVPPGDVESYMRVQESRGVEVSSYKWSGSGHCEHYRRYPHEYAFQISKFLTDALKDW